MLGTQSILSSICIHTYQYLRTSILNCSVFLHTYVSMYFFTYGCMYICAYVCAYTGIHLTFLCMCVDESIVIDMYIHCLNCPGDAQFVLV